jgi:hypothetical protein
MQDSSQSMSRANRAKMKCLARGFLILSGVMLLFLAPGCRKEPDAHFLLNTHDVLPPNGQKERLKTTEQWVAILYTNLFQTGMSASNLYDVGEVFMSIGDQEIAREVLLSNFMNQEGVTLPTVEDMEANLDGFVEEAYMRFFVRMPSQAERTYVKGFITSHPGMTPELVYTSLALSTEYLYY